MLASQSEPAISADGRIVAYTYRPPTGGATAAVTGAFILAWDRTNGNVEVVSRNVKGGRQGGARQPTVCATGAIRN